MWQGQFTRYHTANVADIQCQPGDKDVCGKVSLLATTQQMWQTSNVNQETRMYVARSVY